MVEAGQEARGRALVTALDHAGLSVGGLDAARGFYERAFGFELEFAFDLPGGIRGAMLRLESGGRLELFEHPEPEAGLTPVSPLEALATRGSGASRSPRRTSTPSSSARGERARPGR